MHSPEHVPEPSISAFMTSEASLAWLTVTMSFALIQNSSFLNTKFIISNTKNVVIWTEPMHPILDLLQHALLLYLLRARNVCHKIDPHIVAN